MLWYLLVTLAVALNIAAWGGLTYAVVQLVRGKVRKPVKRRRATGRPLLTTSSHRRQRAAMTFS